MMEKEKRFWYDEASSDGGQLRLSRRRHRQKDRLKNRLHRLASSGVNRMINNCTPLKSAPQKASGGSE